MFCKNCKHWQALNNANGTGYCDSSLFEFLGYGNQEELNGTVLFPSWDIDPRAPDFAFWASCACIGFEMTEEAIVRVA